MGFRYDINSSMGLPGPTSLSSALLRALPGDQRLVSVMREQFVCCENIGDEILLPC